MLTFCNTLLYINALRQPSFVISENTIILSSLCFIIFAVRGMHSTIDLPFAYHKHAETNVEPHTHKQTLIKKKKLTVCR